jgi:hypothetical protein
MHSIDIYIDDEQQRKRRRRKWLIPLIVGVSAALAVGGEKPIAPAPTPVVIAPPEPVRPPPDVVEPLPVPTPTPIPTATAPPLPLPGRIAVGPVRLDFGDGPLARGVPAQLAMIRNEGEQPLSRVSAVADGPFLATSGCPNELAPGDQCMIAVVFSPKQPGKFAGSLKIAAGDERAQVQLHGSIPRPREVTPPAPVPVAPPIAEIVPPPAPTPAPQKPPAARTLCFDPPLVRFTSTGRQTITLTNPEPTPIRVVAILPIGGQGRTVSGYEIESRKCLRALKARQQCKFTVRATELAIQARETMQLTVYYDDPVSGGTRAARTISACGGR